MNIKASQYQHLLSILIRTDKYPCRGYLAGYIIFVGLLCTQNYAEMFKKLRNVGWTISLPGTVYRC